jgi:hypothetical protein
MAFGIYWFAWSAAHRMFPRVFTFEAQSETCESSTIAIREPDWVCQMELRSFAGEHGSPFPSRASPVGGGSGWSVSVRDRARFGSVGKVIRAFATGTGGDAAIPIHARRQRTSAGNSGRQEARIAQSGAGQNASLNLENSSESAT